MHNNCPSPFTTRNYDDNIAGKRYRMYAKVEVATIMVAMKQAIGKDNA